MARQPAQKKQLAEKIRCRHVRHRRAHARNGSTRSRSDCCRRPSYAWNNSFAADELVQRRTDGLDARVSRTTVLGAAGKFEW